MPQPYNHDLKHGTSHTGLRWVLVFCLLDNPLGCTDPQPTGATANHNKPETLSDADSRPLRAWLEFLLNRIDRVLRLANAQDMQLSDETAFGESPDQEAPSCEVTLGQLAAFGRKVIIQDKLPLGYTHASYMATTKELDPEDKTHLVPVHLGVNSEAIHAFSDTPAWIESVLLHELRHLYDITCFNSWDDLRLLEGNHEARGRHTDLSYLKASALIYGAPSALNQAGIQTLGGAPTADDFLLYAAAMDGRHLGLLNELSDLKQMILKLNTGNSTLEWSGFTKQVLTPLLERLKWNDWQAQVDQSLNQAAEQNLQGKIVQAYLETRYAWATLQAYFKILTFFSEKPWAVGGEAKNAQFLAQLFLYSIPTSDFEKRHQSAADLANDIKEKNPELLSFEVGPADSTIERELRRFLDTRDID